VAGEAVVRASVRCVLSTFQEFIGKKVVITADLMQTTSSSGIAFEGLSNGKTRRALIEPAIECKASGCNTQQNLWIAKVFCNVSK